MKTQWPIEEHPIQRNSLVTDSNEEITPNFYNSIPQFEAKLRQVAKKRKHTRLRRKSKKGRHSRVQQMKKRLKNFIKMKEAIRRSELTTTTIGPLKMNMKVQNQLLGVGTLSEKELKRLEEKLHRAIAGADDILGDEESQDHRVPLETREEAMEKDRLDHQQLGHMGSRHNIDQGSFHPEDQGEMGYPETKTHEKWHPETELEKSYHTGSPAIGNKYIPSNQKFDFEYPPINNENLNWMKWQPEPVKKATQELKLDEMVAHDFDHGEKVHHEPHMGDSKWIQHSDLTEKHPVGDILPILERLSEELDDIKKEGIDEIYDSRNDFPCPINGLWTSAVAGVKIKLQTCHDGKVRATVASKGVPHSMGQLLGCEWHLTGLVPSKRECPFALAAVCPEQNKIATFLGQCKTCENSDKIFGNWMFARISRDCNDIMAAQEIKPDVWHRDQMPELQKEQYIDKMSEKMRPFDDSKEPSCKKLHKQCRSDRSIECKDDSREPRELTFEPHANFVKETGGDAAKIGT